MAAAMDSTLAPLELKAYPNPTRDLFFLSLSAPIVRAAVNVYDAKGQQLHHSTMAGDRHQLDVSPFPSGLYHVCIIHGREMFVVDLIKE